MISLIVVGYTINVHYNNTRWSRKIQNILNKIRFRVIFIKSKKKTFVLKEDIYCMVLFIFRPWVTVKSHMALLKVKWEIGRMWAPYSGVKTEDRRPWTWTEGFFFFFNLRTSATSLCWLLFVILFPFSLKTKGPLSTYHLTKQQGSGMRKHISLHTSSDTLRVKRRWEWLATY